jgi:hypothetical protein
LAGATSRAARQHSLYAPVSQPRRLDISFVSGL